MLPLLDLATSLEQQTIHTKEGKLLDHSSSSYPHARQSNSTSTKMTDKDTTSNLEATTVTTADANQQDEPGSTTNNTSTTSNSNEEADISAYPDPSLRLDHSLMDDADDDEEEDEEEQQAETTSELLPSIDETNDTNNNNMDTSGDEQEQDMGTTLFSNTTSVASLFQNSVTHSIRHRRHSVAGGGISSNSNSNSNGSILSQQQHRWDGFVRRGTRLKTLLEDALTEVTTTVKRSRSLDDHDEPEAQRPRVVQVADFTAELAREKTTEVFQLQRVSVD